MKTTYKLLAFATCLVAAGCLISAQFVEDVDFDVDFNNGFAKYTVDLVDITDEEIDNVKRVDVEAVIENAKSGSADTIHVYISRNPNLASKTEVEGASDAYPLLVGYVTKPGPSTDTLSIDEAKALLQIPGPNDDTIREIIQSKQFCIYFTSTGGAVVGRIPWGVLYITFTAKG